MAAILEGVSRNPPGLLSEHMATRTVPIITTTTPTIRMTAPPPDDPMDIITTPTNSSAPPSATKSPDRDLLASNMSDRSQPSPQTEHLATDNIIMPAPVAAAPAVHGPKIVQTAFIHKLYNMLEDNTISHLISWTPTADSFVMQPTHEFSKVLAQYFKHTNISSFVRQLNMYGFHKVSDVFHGGASEANLWEFKHGNGNFKRGDLVGLREIKRRASRHALVHREYNQKPPSSGPGTPAEPMPPMSESSEARFNNVNVEHMLLDLNARLQRSEDYAQLMQVKQHTLWEAMKSVLQINQELSKVVGALAPTHDHPACRDVLYLQGEIQSIVRSLEELHDPAYAGGPPVSPRQLAQDDPRRASLAPPRPHSNYRPAVPSSLPIPARRYGSIGANTTQSSPSSTRTAVPPPPPGPHPLSNVELPPGSLARRHTTADIGANGWHGSNPPPFASGAPSSLWPSAPSHGPGPTSLEDQRIRDSFSHYSLAQQPHTAPHSRPHSRPTTPNPPPPAHAFVNSSGPPAPTLHPPAPAPQPSSASATFGGWSWDSATSRGEKTLSVKDSSAPPTRRGSMAHILNPTDIPTDATGSEGDDYDGEGRGDEDRKRKRLQ